MMPLMLVVLLHAVVYERLLCTSEDLAWLIDTTFHDLLHVVVHIDIFFPRFIFVLELASCGDRYGFQPNFVHFRKEFLIKIGFIGSYALSISGGICCFIFISLFFIAYLEMFFFIGTLL